MRDKSRRAVRKLSLPVGLILWFFTAPAALGHVEVIAPNGGETLDVGGMTTIDWTVKIKHDLLNWDLWYSTEGPDGPWIVIAMNVPPGDDSVGSSHTYDWVVPDDVSRRVRVRIRMDNTGTDYYDISDANLGIRYLAQLSDKESVSAGDSLKLTTAAGSIPFAPFGLFVIDVNGTPTFITIFIGLLNANGRFKINATVPDGLQGLEVTLRAYAPTPTVGTYKSNTVVIEFL